MDMYAPQQSSGLVQPPVGYWSGPQDLFYDDQILPDLHDLLDNGGAGAALRPTPQAGNAPQLRNTPSSAYLLGGGFVGPDFGSTQGLEGPSLALPLIPQPSLRETAELSSAIERRTSAAVVPESTDSGKQSSPTGSSNSKDNELARSDKPSTSLDKKLLAKQRYREKNRKAQARHRERNKRTIEDLTAKVSALAAENSELKLELSIMSTLTKAKDEHYSKLRKTKGNLAYVEAKSLIAESYQLANGGGAEISAEDMEKWSMQDSAAVREANIKKMAKILIENNALTDTDSPAWQELQAEMIQKRQLSLRFAVGKPRFVRSLYAWEREYSKHLEKPNFDDTMRNAVQVMRFTEAQRTQMVRARALLISKMHTILGERMQLAAAAKAGAMEGVADILTSSLEEERQAVFGLLFTFFDETLTMLQECSCDVSLYPWAPDVLAISDVLMEDAVAASPAGVESLGLSAHLVPARDGRPDIDALLGPAAAALPPVRAAEVAGVAAAAGVAWPPETPFQMLSVPVTTRSCGTSGISLLRNVLMFEEGVVPVELPNVPKEILIRTPILHMVRQQLV